MICAGDSLLLPAGFSAGGAASVWQRQGRQLPWAHHSRHAHTLLHAPSHSHSHQSLLKASLEGRELGPEITSLLLHITNKGLLFQLRALQAAGSGSGDDTAAVVAYVQARTAFIKVCVGV